MLLRSDEPLHFSYPVERATQRFRELIVYIAQQCASASYFGATKLNKVLYHSDFRAFERFGVPITGMKYFRLPRGPAPQALKPIQQELIAEGAIMIKRETVGPREQHRTVALRAPILEHFTLDEIKIVDEVIKEVWGQCAREVSDASHDIRWRVLCDRDLIPYEFAFLSSDRITAAEIERTKELADRFKWR
jgi:hypothetical protein